MGAEPTLRALHYAASAAGGGAAAEDSRSQAPAAQCVATSTAAPHPYTRVMYGAIGRAYMARSRQRQGAMGGPGG